MQITFNKFYNLGKERAKHTMQNFKLVLNEKAKYATGSQKFEDVKSEVWRLVVKPYNFENIESAKQKFEQKISTLSLKYREMADKLRFNKDEQISKIQKEISNTNETARSKKQEFERKINSLGEEISAKEQNKIEALLASANTQEDIQSPKSENILINSKNILINFFAQFKENFLLLIPITLFSALLVVDYYVGTSFILEQYRQELFGLGGQERFILQVKIYSMALMLFAVVMLFVEFANTRLFKVYNNLFVQGLKWLLSFFIAAASFMGVVFYLGATRFFSGDVEMQNKLEAFGIILIWFGLVFVCSMLFSEIKNSEHGFKPIFLTLEMFLMPFVAIGFILFGIIFLIESATIYFIRLNRKTRAENIINKDIKRLKKEIKILDKKLTKLNNQFTLQEKLYSKIDKLEKQYNILALKEEEKFLAQKNKIEQEQLAVIEGFNMFKEGVNSTIAKYWNQYILE